MLMSVLDGLTHCVYCILAGYAQPFFPGTSRSGPSLEVFVALTVKGGSRLSSSRFFPYTVRWDHWQYGVVPVLESPLLAPGSEALLNLEESNTDLKVVIRSLLIASFISAGFLPPNFEDYNV